MKLLSAFLILLASATSQAYLENIQHGYTTCTACHTNPQGGGLLTPYGRALGHEIMYSKSTFSEQMNEAQKMWWNVGANLRGMQILRDNSEKTKAVFIPMQTDVHEAVGYENLRAQITYGTKSTNSFGERKTKAIIRDFFIASEATDNFLIQVGKFMAPFGLPIPDHSLMIKKSLGFDQNRETNNLLVRLSSENSQSDFFLFDRTADNSDLTKGGGGQIKYFLNNKHYVSASHFAEGERRIWGLSGFVSFDTYNSGIMFEFDSAYKLEEQDNLAFFRYLLEPTQGIKPYLQVEHRTSYYDRPDRNADDWAVGLQWLPRENIDLTFQVGQDSVGHDEQESTALAILHLFGQLH